MSRFSALSVPGALPAGLVEADNLSLALLYKVPKTHPVKGNIRSAVCVESYNIG